MEDQLNLKERENRVLQERIKILDASKSESDDKLHRLDRQVDSMLHKETELQEELLQLQRQNTLLGEDVNVLRGRD